MAISPDEYRDFQVFKQKHKNWQERLKAKLGGETCNEGHWPVPNPRVGSHRVTVQ